MKLLTNLIFQPKGKHDPALTYSIKDTVMSPDGSKVYFALRDVPSGIALTDEDYWMLQIDLSGSKHALDEAAAAFADQVKFVGTRVKGETAKATGNPVSFLPDAGSLLQPVTVLEPQQQGSGDPYPAGGGRNLIPYPYYDRTKTVNGVTFTVNNDGSITAEGTATANADFDLTDGVSLDFYLNPEKYILSGCPAGGGEAKYFLLLQAKAGSTTVAGYMDGGAGITIENLDTKEYNNLRVWIRVVTGTTINATYYPMLRLASDSDSTYAPPENIRPFIGYDAVDLNYAGKNLLRAVSGNVPAVAIGDNTVTFVNAGDGYFFVEADSFMDGETVTLSFNVSNFSGTFELAPYNDLSYAKALTPNARNAFTFKYRARAHDGNILIDDRERDVSDVTLSNFQLERCSVATDYAAPVMTDHTVQIGQTVYGFRYKWLTGKGVIEWAMVTLTDNHGFYLGEAGGAKRLVVVGVIPGADNDGDGENVNLYCTHYKSDPSPINANNVNNAICGYQQDGNVYIRDDRFNTYEEAAAYFAAQNAAGTPVQIAYKLATPIEIQLTPHVLTAVEPEQNNTLYGDGSIEVEYVKPLHVSIEERVAAALAAAAE